MKKKFLIITIIIAVLGAVIAGISTSQHMRIEREGLENGSFCAISETVNCDIVNASSYSEFLGIPIAAWGFIFYILIALMALVGFFTKTSGKANVSVAWFQVERGKPAERALEFAELDYRHRRIGVSPHGPIRAGFDRIQGLHVEHTNFFSQR
jgi:Vitamin K epoxide reductase family.